MKKQKETQWKKEVMLLSIPIYDQDVIVVINGQFGDAVKFLEKKLNLSYTR